MKPDSVWNLKSSQIQYIVLKSSVAKKNVHLEYSARLNPHCI